MTTADTKLMSPVGFHGFGHGNRARTNDPPDRYYEKNLIP